MLKDNPFYGRIIQGKITDESNTEPISNALVSYFANDGRSFATYTGYDGSYLITLDDPRHHWAEDNGVLCAYKESYIPKFSTIQ